MENSIFFNHVLKGLGFNAYTVGVRIRPRIGGVPGGNYIGWYFISSKNLHVEILRIETIAGSI